MSGATDPGSARLVEVGEPRVERIGGTSRVSARIGDVEIYFESDDLELQAPPELFASALLPAVVQRGLRMRIDEPLDPLWLAGVERILPIWAGWWGTAARLDEVLDAPRGQATNRPRPERAGLCFSGGLDAFHTLLRSGRRIDDLVFAHGYDIRLDDERRFAAAEASVREVAAETGTRALIVRTNLRLQRPFKGSGWGRTHGGALAALGHACRGELGELVISSAYPRASENDFGSTWHTDPGWSSSRLQVSHFGEAFTRDDKMSAVIREPLVRRHLRVCWENLAPTGNCGACEKCVRTMVQLALMGADVEEWPFAGSGSLAERVDRIPSVHPHQVSIVEQRIEICEDSELRAALARLRERVYDPFEDRARRVREREARAAQATP